MKKELILAILFCFLFLLSRNTVVYGQICSGSRNNTGLYECKYDAGLGEWSCPTTGSERTNCGWNSVFERCDAIVLIAEDCPGPPTSCTSYNKIDGLSSSGCSQPSPTPTPTNTPTPTPTPTPEPECDASCDETVPDYTCGAGACASTDRRTGIVKRYKKTWEGSCTTTFCWNVSDVCTTDCGCTYNVAVTSPTNGQNILHATSFTMSGTAKKDATHGADEVAIYKNGVFWKNLIADLGISIDPSTGAFSGTIPVATALSLYSETSAFPQSVPLRFDAQGCPTATLTVTPNFTNTAPTTGTFSILDGSGAVACTDSSCDSGDFITTYDTNYNQKVRVKATFTDVDVPDGSLNRVTDLRYAWIIFDNDTDSGNGTFYRVKFSNNSDGAVNGSDMQSTDAGTTYDGIITLEGLDASYDGGTHTLTVYATMNLTGISKDGPFLTNVYLKTEDFASDITSRELKSSTLDIWNGKDIPVQASRIRDGDTAKSGNWNAQFVSSCTYTVDAVDKTTQTVGIPSSGSFTSVFYLPYVNYGGANQCTITMQSVDTGFYINGSDFTQFSGVSNTRGSGEYTISNHLDQGGASHSGSTIALNYVENAPTTTAGSNTILNSSGGTACNGTSCNNRDLMVDLDDNNNKKVTIEAVFTDVDNNVAAATGNAISDIANAYVIFDIDTNGTNGDIYRIKYTDSGDGANYTLDSENYLSNTSHHSVIAISNASATVASNTLTLEFTLDLSGIAKDGATGPIVGNIYLSATDWAGTTTGRVLSASSLDIWNGKDVKTYSSFYEVNPNASCGSYTGTLSLLIPIFDVFYRSGGAPYTYGGNGSSVTNESLDMTSAKFLPYYYFTTSDIVSSTFGVNTTGEYALSWIDASAYGGGCDKSTGGTISDVSMKNGGAIIAGGAINNGFTQTFKVGLSRISNVWMQIVNGTFYTHSNLTMDVPDGIYAQPFLSYSSGAQNSLSIINGVISGTVNPSNVGYPINWYAKEVSSKKPVTAPSIANLNGYQSYVDSKQQFGTVATIVATDSVISSNPSGTIFMYDQNLSITSDISVPVDSYKVFIINGNLTIGAGVDTLEGIYIVYGNLTIEDDGTANYDRAVTTGAFTLNGSLMVQGSLAINRTLGAANDSAVPFTVQYDPSYMHAMLQDVALVGMWQPYKHRMGE